MQMQPVKSSMITHVGYDPMTRIMRVQITNGGLYEVPDVGPQEHRAFVSDDSVGQHFHRNFKALAKKIEA